MKKFTKKIIAASSGGLEAPFQLLRALIKHAYTDARGTKSTQNCMGEMMFFLFHREIPTTPKQQSRAALYQKRYRLNFCQPKNRHQVPTYYLKKFGLKETKTRPYYLTPENQPEILQRISLTIFNYYPSYCILHFLSGRQSHGYAIDIRFQTPQTQLSLFDGSLPQKLCKITPQTIAADQLNPTHLAFILALILNAYKNHYSAPISTLQLIILQDWHAPGDTIQ